MDERKLTIRDFKKQMQSLDKLDIPETALIRNTMVLGENDPLTKEWMVPPGTVVMEVEYPDHEKKVIRRDYLRFQPPLIAKKLN